MRRNTTKQNIFNKSKKSSPFNKNVFKELTSITSNNPEKLTSLWCTILTCHMISVIQGKLL